MKYIPSIAFEEMSGSAKGVTAAKTRPVYVHKNWTNIRKWVVALTTLRVSTYWVKLLYVMSKIYQKVIIAGSICEKSPHHCGRKKHEKIYVNENKANTKVSNYF